MIEETQKTDESWTEQLKREILDFHTATGMNLNTIGAKAIKNARMWQRLKSGGTITLEKADQVRAWLKKQGHTSTDQGES